MSPAWVNLLSPLSRNIWTSSAAAETLCCTGHLCCISLHGAGIYTSLLLCSKEMQKRSIWCKITAFFRWMTSSHPHRASSGLAERQLEWCIAHQQVTLSWYLCVIPHKHLDVASTVQVLHLQTDSHVSVIVAPSNKRGEHWCHHVRARGSYCKGALEPGGPDGKVRLAILQPFKLLFIKYFNWKKIVCLNCQITYTGFNTKTRSYLFVILCLNINEAEQRCFCGLQCGGDPSLPEL